MDLDRFSDRRRELGDFIRAQRARLPPAAIGLPAAARRRTPGLRREEAAQLAGLSVTWYTWLEQGREIGVSPAALARLADGLRLGRAERTYLFELAGKRDPAAGGEPSPDLVPPPVLAALSAIDAPAYLLDRAWTARGWNAEAEILFSGWLDHPGARNLLRFIFLEPAARALIDGYEERARRVVAEFRAGASAHPGDPAIGALIGDLHRESRLFARLWDEHAVLGREGGERTFNHPTRGFLRFQQVTFTLASHPDLKLTMLVPMPAESSC